MTWTKIERTAHDFKAEKELVGVLKEKVESQFEGFDFILEAKGKEVLVFGKTALQSKLSGVAIGTKIKIVYLGEKKSEKTGRNYEDYEVFVDK
ncbi:hypothetical protein KJ671_04050 [Patescibacteria group bacterium]|nr:hypothetical protein [Patescibacteria group bacterium]